VFAKVELRVPDGVKSLIGVAYESGIFTFDVPVVSGICETSNNTAARFVY
jgi:hypothetical protein